MALLGVIFNQIKKFPLKVAFIYWVAILVVHIGWVDFNLGSPIGWWPAAVAIRGRKCKELYNIYSYAASCTRLCLYASYESYTCPL